MAENGTIAYVDELPNCSFGDDKPANYDFRTEGGSWAYGCDDHFLKYRMHDTLGVGKGQMLVVREAKPVVDDRKPKSSFLPHQYDGYRPATTPRDPKTGQFTKAAVPPNEHDSSDLV